MQKTTCSVAECQRPTKSKGMCGLHYDRQRRLDGFTRPPLPHRDCTVDGCTKNQKAVGLCGMHYWRKLNNGTTDDLRVPTPVGCLIEGCEGKHRSLGYCSSHYYRLLKYGDPNEFRPHQSPPVRLREENHNWRGDDITYYGAHSRVRCQRGPAKNYLCAHCEQRQATDWAYDHTDPEPRVAHLFWGGQMRELHYSPDPSRYIHLCKACHIAFDKKTVSA